MTLLTARPGIAELTSIEIRTNALLRLGDDMFPGKDRAMAWVCGCIMAAGGSHPKICGTLWQTFLARHNRMVDALPTLFAQECISSSLEPHVKRATQRLRTAGPTALPVHSVFMSRGH